MRLIVTVALAVATAALFASSASAVELCKAVEAECSEAHAYGEGTKITAKSSKVEIVTNILTVTCAKSTAEGETTAEAGAPLPADITSMSYSECKTGSTACTVKALHLPYYGLVERTGEDAGTLTFTNWGEGQPASTVECGTFIKCTMGTSELAADVKGGEPATIVDKEEPLAKESGFLCPTSSSLTAEYKIESPSPAHMAQRAIKLCKTTPNPDGTCPGTQGYTGGLKAELWSGVALLVTPIGNITCEEAFMTGANFTMAGSGSITAMTFESAGICSSTLPNLPGVAVTVENLPYNTSSFSLTAANKTILTTTAATPPKLKLKLELGSPVDCRYSATKATLKMNALSPLRMQSAWLMALLAGQPGGCPQTVNPSFEFVIKRTDGGNLWITRP